MLVKQYLKILDLISKVRVTMNRQPMELSPKNDTVKINRLFPNG